MAKRRVGSQTNSLTLDHRKSGIDPIPLCAGGMRHAVGKFSMRATTSVHTSSRSKVCTKSYSSAKLRDSQPWRFRDSQDKKTIQMPLPAGRCRVYYIWEGGGFPQVQAVMSFVSSRSPVARPSTKGALTLC
jgi:hypothetical protein